MNQKASSWIKLLLKFAFSFSIIAYMIYSGRLDLAVVKKGFSEAHLLTYSFLLEILGVCSALYRWKILLDGQGLMLSASHAIRYGMIGAFFNTTMPGAVSGDLIKGWYVVSDLKLKKKTPVLTSILLDRIMGVFGLVLVAVSPILLNWNAVFANPTLHELASAILLLFAGVVVFFLYIMLSVWGPLAYLRKKMDFLENSSIGKIFLGAYDAWTNYRESPMILVKALILSVCNHGMLVTVAILCSHALGEHTIPLYQYLLIVPIGLLSTAIPIAPAGLGVGHVAFAALFKMAGSEQGAEVFTMLVTIQIILNLCGVFFYLRSPKVQMADAV